MLGRRRRKQKSMTIAQLFALHANAINSNGRSKQGHVESCRSTTKYIISSLSQCLWPAKLTGCWLALRGLCPSNYMITWSHNITWQTKTITCPQATVLVTTKLGRIVTYFKELQTIKSYNALIMWSCKVLWQMIITISLLPVYLWQPNLIGW